MEFTEMLMEVVDMMEEKKIVLMEMTALEKTI